MARTIFASTVSKFWPSLILGPNLNGKNEARCFRDSLNLKEWIHWYILPIYQCCHTSPRGVDGNLNSFAWFESRHLVFDSRLLGNLNVLVFIRDLRVRDWLWLGKVLAPLAHPTWGKLLRDLMWFKKKLLTKFSRL